MISVLHDVGRAVHTLGRNPGFTVAAAAVLALSIGVNTGFFTIVNWSLRPPPVDDPDTLVRLERIRGNERQSLFSHPDYADFRLHSRQLSRLTASGTDMVVLEAAEGAHAVSALAVRGAFVSGNFMPTLGARAVLGRTLVEGDEDGGQVVLSHALWRRHFGADAGVIGSRVNVNGQVVGIAGVAAPEFVGLGSGDVTDVWLPLGLHARLFGQGGDERMRARDAAWLTLVGRMAAGVTSPQVDAELAAIGTRLAEDFPDVDHGTRVLATPAVQSRSLRGDEAIFVTLVMAAAAVLLLIACANIAGMLLARAVARQREIGIRLSLGATRRHLVAQLLTESLVLALVGGAGGLLASSWVAQGILWIGAARSGTLPPILTPDGRVYAFTVVLSTLAGLAFGLLPALQATRVDLTATLRDETTLLGRRFGRSRLLRTLVAAQIAASIVLLVSAGLLLQGMVRAQAAEPGFDADRAFAIEMEYPLEGGAARAMVERAAEQVRRLPGTQAVALAAYAPLGASGARLAWRSESGAVELDLHVNDVEPGFFDVLRIPITRGRTFTAAEVERRAPVAIVNESLAARLWPDRDPVGQVLDAPAHVRNFKDRYTVVGVTRDARTASLSQVVPANLYRPFAVTQRPGGRTAAALIARNAQPTRIALLAAQKAIRDIDPRVGLDAASLEGHIDRWRRPAQLASALATAMGAFALLLSVVGLYGLVAYTVRQRLPEIALRLALGAERFDVLLLLARQALRPAGYGLAAGGLALMVVTPLLRGMLYGVSPLDPVTFVAVGALMLFATLAAAYVPARRAAGVDPMRMLRRE
jgi:predicted permease